MRLSPSFYSQLQPWHLQLCLAHSQGQKNTCCMNDTEGIKGSPPHPQHCTGYEGPAPRPRSPRLCRTIALGDRGGTCYPSLMGEETDAQRPEVIREWRSGPALGCLLVSSNSACPKTNPRPFVSGMATSLVHSLGQAPGVVVTAGSHTPHVDNQATMLAFYPDVS